MIPLKLCPQIKPRQLIIYGKCNENASASAKASASEYYIYIAGCILKYFNFNICKIVKYKVIKSCKNPNVFKK